MIDDTSVVAQLVETLTARGLRLIARGRRLELLPKRAFGELSNEERAALKQHKAAIIAFVNERHAGVAGPSVQAAAPTTSGGVAPTSAPAPEPCPYCYRAPCIGSEHPAFATMHPHDPAVVEKRRQEATDEMFESFGRARRRGDLPRW